MSNDEFPKYIVFKCLNMEELTALLKLNTNLPFERVKVTKNLNELAKDSSFTKAVSSPQRVDNLNSQDVNGTLMDATLDDESESNGPEPKKSRLYIDVFHYLTDKNRSHDRLLMVENAQFYIQSDKLTEHSNYFRSLFTSDFKEKRQEIISLQIFDAEKIKLFMDAIYKPDEFEFIEEDIETIMETFVYFQAVDYLNELLKEKSVLKSITESSLLFEINKFGLKDLLKTVEQLMVEEINKYYVDRAPWTLGKHHRLYVEPVREYLTLSKQYTLKKLRKVMDAHLAAEFIQNIPHSLDNFDYSHMLGLYCLAKLSKAIEQYAVSVINENARDIIDLYLSDNLKIPMISLQKATGQCLLREFNENELTKAESFEFYLNMSETCKYPELKERVCRSLEELYKDVGQPNKIKVNEYYELIFKYDIEPMKSRQEDYLVTEFHKNKDYGKLYEDLKHESLSKLREVVEIYLLNKFTNSKKEDSLINDLCDFTINCHMDKLKDTIEDYFLVDFYLNQSLGNMKQSLYSGMENYKIILSSFLKSNITLSPNLRKDIQYIDELPYKYQTFILRSIFDFDH